MGDGRDLPAPPDRINWTIRMPSETEMDMGCESYFLGEGDGVEVHHVDGLHGGLHEGDVLGDAHHGGFPHGVDNVTAFVPLLRLARMLQCLCCFRTNVS